jgi:CRISPR/Cas system-associated endonuclease/helicase Cas3
MLVSVEITVIAACPMTTKCVTVATYSSINATDGISLHEIANSIVIFDEPGLHNLA